MAKVVNPVEAQAEQARRELSRRRLADYTAYIYRWWQAADFHRLICAELEDVEQYIASEGERGTQALIVEVPPQHGKSTITSRSFPSWILGKHPDTNIILATYAAEFSAEHSREVRQIINSTEFKAVFGSKSTALEPVEISADSFAKGNWTLASPHRGGMLAIGVEGGATGRTAGLIVIDDPFKNREEAESANERKKRLAWMTSSIMTRVQKGTAIILIHTRWHREDLIGEMLKAQAKDPRAIQWRVVSLPALPLDKSEYATDADDQHRAMLTGVYKPLADVLGRSGGSLAPLWPEKVPVETLTRVKASLEANGKISDWYSLYQQQPRPSDGVFFGEAMFRIEKKAPDGLEWVGYSDLAMGESERADWNTNVRVAVDQAGVMWVRDMLRVHDIDSFLPALADTMCMPSEAGTVWGFETNGFQKQVFKDFIADTRLIGKTIDPITVDKDKVTRARPVRSRGLAKKIVLVEGPWIQEFLLEAFDFPTGRHDDQIDSLSGGLQMADEAQLLRGPLAV